MSLYDVEYESITENSQALEFFLQILFFLYLKNVCSGKVSAAYGHSAELLYDRIVLKFIIVIKCITYYGIISIRYLMLQ